MINKLKHIIIAVIIYFIIASVIQFAIGWQAENPWRFVIIWAVIMGFVDALVLQRFRKKRAERQAGPHSAK